MKPDSDSDEFVDALRTDLPSAAQEARLRARLAAIAAVGVTTLATSSAAATGLAAKGAAGASVVARIGALSWGAKLGLASAVCATAAAGPLVLSRTSTPSAPAAVTSARTTPVSGPTARHLGRKRQHPEPAQRSPNATDEQDATAAPEPVVAIAPELSAARRDLGASPHAGVAAPAPVPAGAARPFAPLAEPAVTAPTLTHANEPPTASFAVPVSTAPPSAVTATAEPAAVTTLREETLLIDRALAATRAGDFARARQLLVEHEQLFPNGLLRRERERARTKLAEQSTNSGKP